MRIACIYLPSFPLQAHVRERPHLAGNPFAVANAAERPLVLACSRAAYEQGVRTGMAVPAARAVAPGVEVLPSDPARYRGALEALADALMAFSPVVDIGGSSAGAETAHRRVYIKVPPRVRGAAFGARLLGSVARQGFRARVGIADDKFTARVAAEQRTDREANRRLSDGDGVAPFSQECTVVPRAGSAAFLAPLPLSLLPIEPHVLRVLGSLGVSTLGDFASLPPPTIGRPWEHADLQALARGAGPGGLRAHQPGRRIAERIELERTATGADSMSAALRSICDRLAERLAGVERAASRLELRIAGPAGERAVARDLSDPAESSTALVDALTPCLGESPTADVIEVAITGDAEPCEDNRDLFAASAAPPAAEAIDAAIARLESFRLEPVRPRVRRQSHRRTRRAPRRSHTTSAQIRLGLD